MKKKTYKAIQNRYYNELKKRIIAEGKIEQYRITAEDCKDETERYRKRFREFGMNVETIDPEPGCIVKQLKWEIEPQLWGEYVVLMSDTMTDDLIIEQVKERIVSSITKGLIEQNLVQFIKKEKCDFAMLKDQGTFGAKLFVVPWEQMPHKRKIELMEMAHKRGE